MDIHALLARLRPSLTRAEVVGSCQAVGFGLLIGVVATAITFLLGIPFGTWFLQPEPDGTPEWIFDSPENASFFFIHFSLIAAAMWPGRGRSWLSCCLMVALFLGLDPVLKVASMASYGLEMLFPLGIYTGLMGVTFHHMVHGDKWPPFKVPTLARKRLLHAPLFWCGLCLLGINTCSPCNEGSGSQIEDVGNGFFREAVAHYLEQGQLPENFREMGIDLPRRDRHGWTYRQRMTPFGISLTYGDYGDCGWEVYASLRTSWPKSVARPPEPVREEAMTLFRHLLAYWLRTGETPKDLPTMDILETWGSYGPWRLRPHKVGENLYKQWVVDFERLVETETGPEWEVVLRLHPIDWYHNS